MILDTLEAGGMREPFKGPRLAIPMTKTAREGGTFAGKVMRKFHFERLNLVKKPIISRSRDKRPSLRSGSNYRVTGRQNTYKVELDDGTAQVWRRIKGSEDSELLYKIGPPKKMKKRLDFFDVTKHYVITRAKTHFRDLIDSLGNASELMGQFKYATRAFWK